MYSGNYISGGKNGQNNAKKSLKIQGFFNQLKHQTLAGF